MGLADALHAGERCGSVPCLGKKGSDLVRGDSLRLYQAPRGERVAELLMAMVEEEAILKSRQALVERVLVELDVPDFDDEAQRLAFFERVDPGRRNSIPERFYVGEPLLTETFQLAMGDGIVKVVDGTFVTWDDEVDAEIAVFGIDGHPLSEDED
jgi:hypothetical protein